jgi:RNA polymerase sigma-70 factor (TIGR02943 family)
METVTSPRIRSCGTPDLPSSDCGQGTLADCALVIAFTSRAADRPRNEANGDEASSDYSAMSTADLQSASRWVDDHGECLYRYALVRVRKAEVAEDLVQETFLAAVRGYEQFGGRSSERSWLVGILKNKIVDHFRKLGRETSFTEVEFLSDEFSEKFVSLGFWNHDLGPHEWKPEPDEVMHRAEFWQVMRNCLAKLPEKIRAVFTMREMDDVPSRDVCTMLSISDSNLWVMLHRARMALRECLEMNWFDTPAGGAH